MGNHPYEDVALSPTTRYCFLHDMLQKTELGPSEGYGEGIFLSWGRLACFEGQLSALVYEGRRTGVSTGLAEGLGGPSRRGRAGHTTRVEGSEWGRRWVSADKTRAAPAAGIRGVSMGTDRGCSEGSSSSAGLTCWPWRVRPGIKHRWRVPFGVCRGWAEGPCRAPETARSRRRPARRPRPCSEWVSGGGCNTGCGVAAHRLARCSLPLGFAGAEPRA